MVSLTSIDGLKDWFLTNADNLLIVPQGPLSTEFLAAGVGARWHQGFVNAIGEIWNPLFAAVSAAQKEKERCFWITGHSLGGALATMAAWLFTNKTMKPHQVYTFGAPMVGNKVVAEALEKELGKRLARYANGPDPVPFLPMMSGCDRIGGQQIDIVLCCACQARSDGRGIAGELPNLTDLALSQRDNSDCCARQDDGVAQQAVDRRSDGYRRAAQHAAF